MKPLQLHPLSALVGLAVATLALLAMSQATAGSNRINRELLVAYGPHARDMVVIREGTPYTVPHGKLLVMTAIGNSGFIQMASTFLVNGVPEGASALGGCWPSMPTIHRLPPGHAVPAGSVVEVVSDGTVGRAWGYLESL